MKNAIRLVLSTALTLCAVASYAAGVANEGTYRTANGEREPEAIDNAVRLVPPPPGGLLKTSVAVDKIRYHVGDGIKLNFGVNHDSYVWIFVTDAAGISRQIFPNYYDRSNFMRAGKKYEIPDRGYDLEVSGPAGRVNVDIVAIQEDAGFLDEFRRYSAQDPYPVVIDGAVAIVRRMEELRTEPSALQMQPLRPAPRKDLWATNYATFTVMDKYGSPEPYKVPRYGQLDIDTYPNNARIYVNGLYNGRTPQTVDRLPIGYHKVLITKNGYLPYEVSVYVKGNETKQMDVFLKQTPNEPGYSRSAKPETGWWNALDPLAN